VALRLTASAPRLLAPTHQSLAATFSRISIASPTREPMRAPVFSSAGSRCVTVRHIVKKAFAIWRGCASANAIAATPPFERSRWRVIASRMCATSCENS
jgi:hypothetical protein